MYAFLPLTGTPRKSLLEMSTTVQRSRLRTSTWAKLSRSSRWVCVEETLTSTVCCKPGPVRADTGNQLNFNQISCIWNHWITGSISLSARYLWWSRCVSFSTEWRCCWIWCLSHSCRRSWVPACSQNVKCNVHSSAHGAPLMPLWLKQK